ncbi:hypothetical protein [Salinactinospora qingdaonensis]|uniref:hypothetical protein n=1 Tax=Salinactinospora qingdaonensis TaxID=702744 RepID=UPI0031E7E981
MDDADDPAPSDGAGEGDPARAGGVDGIAGAGSQVDAAMAGQPRFGGRSEGAHDRQLACEGAAPGGGVGPDRQRERHAHGQHRAGQCQRRQHTREARDKRLHATAVGNGVMAGT